MSRAFLVEGGEGLARGCGTHPLIRKSEPEVESPGLPSVGSWPMPLDFRTKRVRLNQGKGTITENDSINFDSRVNRADVAVKGFQLDFQPPAAANPINVVEVGVATVGTPQGNSVDVVVTARYSDKNSQAEYTGFVEVLAVADVV
jgi:hypothetical protein